MPNVGATRWLEARVPPPVVMLVLGGVAWVVARGLPELAVELPFGAAVAIAFATAGLALNGYPKLAFRRAGTTVNPLRPDASTRLVTTGIYRITRNPMYLGHALILIGWVIDLGNPAGLLVVPAFGAYLGRFQIEPEERALSTLFPAEYAAFRCRVRRWL